MSDCDLPTRHLWAAFRAIGKANFESRSDSLHAAAYAQYHLEQFIQKAGDEPIGIEHFDEEEQEVIRDFLEFIRHHVSDFPVSKSVQVILSQKLSSIEKLFDEEMEVVLTAYDPDDPDKTLVLTNGELDDLREAINEFNPAHQTS